ncbi:hypothetical protein [Cuneatibacter caecimuris]|uniref:Uncharacterized protein n=1 Tax=Cuneatibacter caecimuris TaxID=1796618 RepID=A0A4Q7PPI5_9FIRM|nr:hypothetical protein [Cuneatibacter caecimuris]RZT02929.1 hypothetical protein EV209_1059 [Cuneatibacter caecimuris]
MTYKEKLQQEHPDYVDKKYSGGCLLCPYSYGYESSENSEHACLKLKGDCEACWNREIPGTQRTAEAATPDGSENN